MQLKKGSVVMYSGRVVKVLAIEPAGVRYQILDHDHKPTYTAGFQQFLEGMRVMGDQPSDLPLIRQYVPGAAAAIDAALA